MYRLQQQIECACRSNRVLSVQVCDGCKSRSNDKRYRMLPSVRVYVIREMCPCVSVRGDWVVFWIQFACLLAEISCACACLNPSFLHFGDGAAGESLCCSIIMS